MRETYRGHSLEASREETPEGEELLYYSVFREPSGHEVAGG